MKKITVLFLVFTVCGCAGFEPLVRDFNVISVPEEIQIGQQAAQEVSQQMRIVTDRTLNSRVNGIGQRLVRALPHRDFSYEFRIVDDPSPNAFTIPGGKIYAHTGLLNFVLDDEELAGVLAHEIGHAYERHPAKSISLQYGVETLSKILFKGNQTALKSLAIQTAKSGIVSHYGREDEFAADEAGFYILRNSGIRSDGLLRFFGRLEQLQRRGATVPFLSSHPPTPERIARLRALESGQVTRNI